MNSEITLREAIQKLETFCSVKIIFNNIILYNDYDEDALEVENGLYGELKKPLDVIPKRLWQFDNYFVSSITIKIVDCHHSIIDMKGFYNNKKVIL